MSLKDNFNQAMREFLKKDEANAEKDTKPAKKKTDIDEILESSSVGKVPTSNLREELISAGEETVIPNEKITEQIPLTVEKEPVLEEKIETEPAEVEHNSSPFSSFAQYAQDSGAVRSGGNLSPNSGANNNASSAFNSFKGGSDFGGNSATSKKTPPLYSAKTSDSAYYETEETTIISRNTIIDGNIRSFANISVDGSVKGNVAITKNINVTGKIVGDIECNNSTMTGASMQGNISSKGQVQLDRDSLILGDIAAQYLDLNGKIKGNIECGGKAEFKTDAVILGNITASTITVLDGATIQGYVNTTFLQESSTSIFPEVIALDG